MTAKNKNRNILPERASGLLMHITSLPGSYHTGDLGPEARKFAEFLQRTGQTFWQLLPLNPVEQRSGYSPYSSASAFAGNPLLISPDDLVATGLVNASYVRKLKALSKEKADFTKAGDVKELILRKAFEMLTSSSELQHDFEGFCKQEQEWLEDFALYQCLKNTFELPWYQWRPHYKDRQEAALKSFGEKHSNEVQFIKFQQYVFFRQWRSLKEYCNARDIRLFGDLPFYVSYDSADVWANREIFSLNAKGRMEFVSGVPPDYFNEDGQLWGMPVFRWDVLKRQKYNWWVRRIRKNIELFDLIRLDHFRAFSDFWAVPASQKTARKGKWNPGPGEDLFKTLSDNLGELPFIAEDLGDIDEPVHQLRKQFRMPGMKVLQFAFGGDFPNSDYLPHQYSEDFVVYTGTHDNNTTRGWFQNDIGKTEKQNLTRYFGASTSAGKIHTLLIRLAYWSVAKYAIIPVQDILGLSGTARMNAPATVEKNWTWRMKPGAFTPTLEKWLKEVTLISARAGKE